MTPTARSRALRHNRVLKTVSPPSPPLDLYPDFGFLLTLRGALSKAAILLKPQVLVWYSFFRHLLERLPYSSCVIFDLIVNLLFLSKSSSPFKPGPIVQSFPSWPVPFTLVPLPFCSFCSVEYHPCQSSLCLLCCGQTAHFRP